MIYCQNCRQANDEGTNFCRFCGNRFISPLAQQQSTTENYSAPRPYLWKTDEFQVNNKSAPITQEIKKVQPLYQPQPNQSLGYPQPAFMATGYRCPRCGTNTPPIYRRQISTAGWITFGVLLIMTVIFFWIGLLLKEDVKVCPVCNFKYN